MVVVGWNRDHHIKVGSHQKKVGDASGLGGRWKDEKVVHIAEGMACCCKWGLMGI